MFVYLFIFFVYYIVNQNTSSSHITSHIDPKKVGFLMRLFVLYNTQIPDTFSWLKPKVRRLS